MKQKLTILVCTVNAVGHVNACTGATLPLVSRGHNVIFLVEEAFRDKLAPLGYREHVYHAAKDNSEQNPGERMANTMVSQGLIGSQCAQEKTKNLLKYFESRNTVEAMRYLNENLKVALELYKPDLVYYDANCLMPALYYSWIPWIKNHSMTPVFYVKNTELPPGGSGLPFDDRTDWAEFAEIRKEYFNSAAFNDLVESWGYPRYSDDLRNPDSQILTVYGYPDELDYPKIRELGWFNLEVFNRPHSKLFPLNQLGIPDVFLNDSLNGNFSGKLIYLSMGSMGSVDLVLMKRLVGILGQTAHKYIVSKGPLHYKYNLPENMFGQRFLDQPKIVPQVDLVITHGGNNTVTEVFATGKPMIVLPQFVDQFDNAQRLQETGFGARIDPYNFEDRELVDTIERLLYDEKLRSRLEAAALRIQCMNKSEELADKIEQLIIS